jgi:LPXTG-site transpeptidase (sortase) family protein
VGSGMRSLLSVIGSLLVIASLSGLAVLAVWGAAAPTDGIAEAAIQIEAASPADDPSPALSVPPGLSPPGRPADAADTPTALPPSLPITRVVIPAIGLDAQVVPASLSRQQGGTTWEVPAFKAGHAQFSARAGQLGTAVLLGHLSSLNLGNVFENLHRVKVGDQVHALSGDVRFDYRIYETRSIQRSEMPALQSPEAARLFMLTCSGVWLPFIWDYTERLVVQAELRG